ncbi:hypothetical protein [Salinicola rhizosphaerae]|uniref:ParB/Sulfiredoxin domain-containing protein n=1 Tax=Salinicola rhizosphaerae TaxID=1443141 RepID=A0ABQ3DTI3_9GAMM|nr:hypothetical protein [Salinicola rhizosphaerae]GHB14381.1 hypothetical protein GCM10009038_10920 [Salinicola rhizosphaerae]
MRWGLRRARWQENTAAALHRCISLPLEKHLFERWLQDRMGAARIEAKGLPRRALDMHLDGSLVLDVDPRQLIRDFNAKGVGGKKPSSSNFIWDGDWDLSRGDLRRGSRYRFISDLDEHRHDLTQTERFRQYHSWAQSGKPFSSYRQGLLLDSDARILAYLETYLGFLDDMAVNGFDAGLGKDDLGVAVTRDGRLLKINRGLHRLAMAQRLGLRSVPVRVRAVHRLWWDRVVQDNRGQAALERVRAALTDCRPELEPGPLDPGDDLGPIEWPTPRRPAADVS